MVEGYVIADNTIDYPGILNKILQSITWKVIFIADNTIVYPGMLNKILQSMT